MADIQNLALDPDLGQGQDPDQGHIDIVQDQIQGQDHDIGPGQDAQVIEGKDVHTLHPGPVLGMVQLQKLYTFPINAV